MGVTLVTLESIVIICGPNYFQTPISSDSVLAYSFFLRLSLILERKYPSKENIVYFELWD